MAIYELRTYTLQVGKLAEAVEVYQSLGWPAIEPYQDKLVGYFTGDIGALNRSSTSGSSTTMPTAALSGPRSTTTRPS